MASPITAGKSAIETDERNGVGILEARDLRRPGCPQKTTSQMTDAGDDPLHLLMLFFSPTGGTGAPWKLDAAEERRRS